MGGGMVPWDEEEWSLIERPIRIKAKFGDSCRRFSIQRSDGMNILALRTLVLLQFCERNSDDNGLQDIDKCSVEDVELQYVPSPHNESQSTSYVPLNTEEQLYSAYTLPLLKVRLVWNRSVRSNVPDNNNNHGSEGEWEDWFEISDSSIIPSEPEYGFSSAFAALNSELEVLRNSASEIASAAASSLQIIDDNSKVVSKANLFIRKTRQLKASALSAISDTHKYLRDLTLSYPVVNSEILKNFMNSEGVITNVQELKLAIFQGGIDPELRPFLWRFLYDLYPYSSNINERKRIHDEKEKEYYAMRSSWQREQDLAEAQSESLTIPPTDITSGTYISSTARGPHHSLIHTVWKDVHRTDRTLSFFAGDDNANLLKIQNLLVTYALLNPTISYAQGMSDLVSPLLVVLEDEADAFWCFVSLMETQQVFFHHDQKGMSLQMLLLSQLLERTDPRLHTHFAEQEADSLIFCYRWLLVNFKREFSFKDGLRLAETLRVVPEELSPCELGNNSFVLFVALAIFAQIREHILGWDLDHEELFLLISGLANGKLEINRVLKKAKQLCVDFCNLNDCLAYLKSKYTKEPITEIRFSYGVMGMT